MSTATLTERDARTRQAVVEQLEWDPAVDAAAIGVSADEGAVTLTGYVNSYAEKLAAERAAKRVHGVRAVANDVEVRLALDRTDADIAHDAAMALKVHASIPQSVQAAVHHGTVTLTGRVPWLYQKRLAAKAATHIRGVRHVVDRIEVMPAAAAEDVHRRIVRALHRAAAIDASRVEVDVTDGVVRLSGVVQSWSEREAAAGAAAAAPGIIMVDNQLVVEPRTMPPPL